MKIERDERKFDFHEVGLAIKKAREHEGMTQDQLGLNVFYQLTTMFGISVDQFFYSDMSTDEAAKKRINILLNSLNESELRLVEGIIRTIKENRETEGA